MIESIAFWGELAKIQMIYSGNKFLICPQNLV